MKKILATLLALVTILSATVITVSAAATDEMLGPEEAMEIITERLGYEPFNVTMPWGPHYWGLEMTVRHLDDPLWGIRVEGDEWQMSLADFEEELACLEKQGFFDVEMVIGTAYERYSSYVIYGETIYCEWLPMSFGDTVVEVLFDVASEEYLTIDEVSELFYEEFGYKPEVQEFSSYFDAYCINDRRYGEEYLIPVKEEGLPVEVWEAFVTEFEDEFNYDVSYLNELGVQVYFAELLGYKTEVSVFRWGEDDVTIDVTFDHLGGKTYCLEAVYVEEYNEYCVTDVALEAFLDRHPECSVVPNFTWKQLMKLLEFYYKW
jgi:hypothetical protein